MPDVPFIDVTSVVGEAHALRLGVAAGAHHVRVAMPETRSPSMTDQLTRLAVVASGLPAKAASRIELASTSVDRAVADASSADRLWLPRGAR